MSILKPRILYEDDALIVVDKPSGMLTIPTPKKETTTLTHWLNAYLDRKHIEANAYPCHRLDRETSGLIIYAKGKKAQKLMMYVFHEGHIRKQYLAFVQGRLKNPQGEIRREIYNRNKRRAVPALTLYRRLAQGSGSGQLFTVLEVSPVTGRTNQIRIHLANIGHPIVGESVFANRSRFKLRFPRTALHAWKLEFRHPLTDERSTFEAPIPEDMRKLWKPTEKNQ